MFHLKKISANNFMEVDAFICQPKNSDEILDCVRNAKINNLQICAFGAPVASSNIATITKQIILDLTKLDNIIEFDWNKSLITVQPGTRISTILRLVLPLNLTLNSITGFMKNTVIGNISNDVNGKDAWKNGNFSENVVSMKVILSSGEEREISKENDSNLFDAICGGLGLLVIIKEITLQLTPISSYYVNASTRKCSNLEEQLNYFDSITEDKSDFAHSWIDPFTNKRQIGRGLFLNGKFSEFKHESNRKEIQKLLTQRTHIMGLKNDLFWKITRNLYYFPLHYMATKVKYNKPIVSPNRQMPLTKFQSPINYKFPNWNQIYLPKGFREIQILFSKEVFPEALSSIMIFCKKNGIVPIVSGIRKHKIQNSLLSFHGDGYSLLLNFGLSNFTDDKIDWLHEHLVEICMKYKGKLYLGKFPFISPTVFKEMFPRNREFIEIKKQLDPGNMFWSDAATCFLKDLV
jgi:hypothetical protein